MASSTSKQLGRYFPYVILATLGVAVVPFVAVYFLESSGVLKNAIVSTVVGVVLSISFARLGAFLWMRHSGSRDLVFGDLMLWGWARRLRTEQKMSDAMHLLGFDPHGERVREVDLPIEKQEEVLRELAAALEAGDPFTHGHTRRVTRYSYMLAKTMRLPADTVAKIRAAAAVHDVGKIDTPSEVLNKPGRLTDEEYDIMKRHSATGAKMVERLGDPEITAMVRHHHERIDGAGYPDRLAGKQIPLGARVIAVADTFDAIISTRAYRAARKHKEAIEILKSAAGTQLDEQAVDAFLSYYSGRGPFAWWISVSTAVQRVLGGIGGWLQHAKAAGLSQGTASLAAAVALSSGAAAIDPGAASREDVQPKTIAVAGAEADPLAGLGLPGLSSSAGGVSPALDNGGSRTPAAPEDASNGEPSGPQDATRSTAPVQPATEGDGVAEPEDPAVVTEPRPEPTPQPEPSPQPSPQPDPGPDTTVTPPTKSAEAKGPKKDCVKDDKHPELPGIGATDPVDGAAPPFGQGAAPQPEPEPCTKETGPKDGPKADGDKPGKGTDKPGKGPDAPGKGTDKPGKGPDAPGKGTDKPGKGPDAPGKGPDGPGKPDAPGAPVKPGKDKPVKDKPTAPAPAPATASSEAPVAVEPDPIEVPAEPEPSDVEPAEPVIEAAVEDPPAVEPEPAPVEPVDVPDLDG